MIFGFNWFDKYIKQIKRKSGKTLGKTGKGWGKFQREGLRQNRNLKKRNKKKKPPPKYKRVGVLIGLLYIIDY
jgi:hypothetical protein